MEPVSYVTISSVGSSVYSKVLILTRLFAGLAAKPSSGWETGEDCLKMTLKKESNKQVNAF